MMNIVDVDVDVDVSVSSGWMLMDGVCVLGGVYMCVCSGYVCIYVYMRMRMWMGVYEILSGPRTCWFLYVM
jgi:hypothetical protein